MTQPQIMFVNSQSILDPRIVDFWQDYPQHDWVNYHKISQRWTTSHHQNYLREGTNVLPFRNEVVDLLDIAPPKYDTNFNKTFADVTDQRYFELHEKYGDSEWLVLWSGGIDSTLILALLRKKFPDIDVETISIKFAQSLDESEKAAKTSEFFGVKHQTIQLENYLKELPQAIFAVGLPFWDLHWYYVVKKARAITKHLASGDGGDELFGGYTFRYSKFLSLVTESSTPLDKVKAYLACHERDNVSDQQDVFGPKAEFSWDKIYQFLLPYFDNKLDPLNQVFLADYNGKLLYNFSIVNTKIHNHFEINNVSPILSQKLIQYSTRLASDQKYDHNNDLGKLPLRQLLKKFGTDHFISAEKHGFSVNTVFSSATLSGLGAISLSP